MREKRIWVGVRAVSEPEHREVRGEVMEGEVMAMVVRCHTFGERCRQAKSHVMGLSRNKSTCGTVTCYRCYDAIRCPVADELLFPARPCMFMWEAIIINPSLCIAIIVPLGLHVMFTPC